MKRVVKSVLTNKAIKLLLIWTAVWVFALYGLGYIATKAFIFEPTYPYYEGMLAPLGPAWLARWGGFDGVHYLTIARQGYFGTGLIQAFFPVYPLLVRFADILNNALLTGVIISALFTFLSVVMLVKLAALDQKGSTLFPKFLIGLTLAMLSFPTAFFFLGMYTESLFLFLALLSFYFARKRKWMLAGLSAGIASGTRIVGVALFPALIVQAYLDHKKEKKVGLPWRNWFVSLLSVVGLAIFMAYLQRVFHDPVYFLHVQKEFGGGRQESLVLLPQVIYRYIKILLTVHPNSWSYFAYAQELFLTLEIGALLTIATIRHKLLNSSYLVFSWFAFLIPPLTGTFQSMPRYVLVIFPIYLLYAQLFVNKQRWATLIFLLHAILLVVNVLLFFQGKWVA